MNRRKKLTIAVGAIVAVGVLVAIAIPVRASILTTQACEVVNQYVADNGAVQTVGDGPTGIAVLGDSYTAGDVLDDRADRWVTRFAEIEDATVTFDGIGSTGFVASGACEGNTFADRIGNLDAAEIFIIQGGLNDVGLPGVEDAAEALIESAPGARVIVIGPIDSDVRAGEDAVDASLRTAAEAQGAEYVSALDWPVELVDGLHMTPDGHAEYASLVAEAVAR